MSNHQKIYELITKLQASAKEIASEKSGLEVSPQFRGAVVSHLNKYLGGDALRRAFLGILFAEDRKPMSSKMLTAAEVYTLSGWIGAVKIEGEWVVSNEFIDDCIDLRVFYGEELQGSGKLMAGVSIFDSFCSECGRPTEHIYMGFELKCLVCYPDLDYRRKVENGNTK